MPDRWTFVRYFALGGTLFWCLTGQLPFPAQGTLFETMSRRMTRPPPSARSFRPDLPPEIDAVLARMMAIQPSDRYATPCAVMRAWSLFSKRNRQRFPRRVRPIALSPGHEHFTF